MMLRASLQLQLALVLLHWASVIATTMGVKRDCSQYNLTQPAWVNVQISGSSFQVYCNPDGWTTVMNLRDPTGNGFNRSWSEFKKGFRSDDGTSVQWIGTEAMYWLTNQAPSYRLRIVLLEQTGQEQIGEWAPVTVASELSRYQLTVGRAISITPGFQCFFTTACGSYNMNGSTFSTFDFTTTNPNCPSNHLGGFWYNYCSPTLAIISFRRLLVDTVLGPFAYMRFCAGTLVPISRFTMQIRPINAIDTTTLHAVSYSEPGPATFVAFNAYNTFQTSLIHGYEAAGILLDGNKSSCITVDQWILFVKLRFPIGWPLIGYFKADVFGGRPAGSWGGAARLNWDSLVIQGFIQPMGSTDGIWFNSQAVNLTQVHLAAPMACTPINPCSEVRITIKPAYAVDDTYLAQPPVMQVCEIVFDPCSWAKDGCSPVQHYASANTPGLDNVCVYY